MMQLINDHVRILFISKAKKINQIKSIDERVDALSKLRRELQDEIDDAIDEMCSIVDLKNEISATKPKSGQTIIVFDEATENEINREIIYDYLNEKMNELSWYEREMINLYLKLGTYRKIEEHTQIPWESAYHTIKRAFKKIIE